MDKSVLEVILKTCKNTDIPPKPSRKAVNIRLIEIFLQTMEDITLIPFVISKKPVNRPWAKFISIFKLLKIGLTILVKILKIPPVFNIEITLENITTNPPIRKIVEILLLILSAKISPRLDKEANFEFETSPDLERESSVLEVFFQNLKIIPTVIHANICVINSKIPIVVLLNIRIPTVPIINRGPELLVKLSNLSHSSFVQIFFSLKEVAILAPTGYPLIIPIIKAKEPSPLILNKGFIKTLRKEPNILIMFVCISNSVETKNGKRAGTTEVAHRESPDFTAAKLVLEKIKIHSVNDKNRIAKKFLFNFIT